MPDSLLRIFLASFLLVLCAPAMAQDVVMPMASQPAPAPKIEMTSEQSMPPDTAEVTILRDEYAGKYNSATLQNLSKLYWRLGAFDFEDITAVANYLKINDCKIYTEYLNDDLEWAKIIEAMQDHLQKNYQSFPLNYQFILQLHFGTYDPVRRGFPIVDNTGFVDSKRVEMDSIDRYREICFDQQDVQRIYPTSAVILLPAPFTLDFIKLDEHVAQAFILRKKSEYSRLGEEARVNQYERTAFLRLRVSFSQYNGNVRGQDNQVMAILFGNIDGYEVFEDVGEQRLMQSVDLRNVKNAPQVSMPPAETNP
jgi:hypothetical protein